MLRPSDLASPALLSGYKGVGYSRNIDNPKKYHAQVYRGKRNKAGHAWQGPARHTAVEAAQDYCDYVNDLPEYFEPAREGYIYCIREDIPGGGIAHVKVGFSEAPEKRVGALQTGNPRPLVVHALCKGTMADEAALHFKYRKDRILGEWFHPTKELLLEFPLDATGKEWGTT